MNIVKDSFKEFTENFIGSSFHMSNNVSIYKSGIDHWSMNFCFINGTVEDKELEFIEKKFDVPGTLFSINNKNNDLIDIDSMTFVGDFPFMLREEVPDFYKAPVYDDMEILSVSDYPMSFVDFVEVFCEIRKIDKDKTMNMIKKEQLKNNNHFFVAYMNDSPVGAFHAISHGENAFIMDALVKENYRNTGVLNAMAKKAKEEALRKEIFNFYSIPTSEFSVRVMNDQGYKPIGMYYLWQNSK